MSSDLQSDSPLLALSGECLRGEGRCGWLERWCVR